MSIKLGGTYLGTELLREIENCECQSALVNFLKGCYILEDGLYKVWCNEEGYLHLKSIPVDEYKRDLQRVYEKLINTYPINYDEIDNVRARYDMLLSKEEKLAIWLHSLRCRMGIDGCSWSYEKNGIAHLWDRGEHSYYLGLARHLFSLTSDENLIRGIVGAVEGRNL